MADTMSCFTEKQRVSIAYFEENLDNWLANPLYRGKYAIIQENTMVGFFDSFDNAFLEAGQKYQEGSYIIQRLISPKDIINFYSPALA
jgi:hypothetical protein